MRRVLLAAIIAVLVVLAACAPSAAPPSPSAAAVPSAPATAPKPAPAAMVEDAAWEKVLQAARKEGRLTAYAFNFVGDAGLAIAAAFEKRHGIKVDIVTGRGAEFIERLKTEKRLGAMTADFTEGSATNVLNMKTFGLTAPLLDLPVLKEKGVWQVEPFAVDAEGHVLVEFSTIYSPWFNTRLLKPEQAPKSYLDLLKPEWKGKIIAHDPVVSSAAYNYFVSLVNARALDWEYVRALGKQELRLMPGGVQAAEALSRGELPLILMNTDSNTSRFAQEGAPIRAFGWQEGNVVNAVVVAAIKDAPHPNAARVFTNWLLTQEGQEVLGKAKSVAVIRKGVPDNRPEGARAAGAKLVVSNAKDFDEMAKLMLEGFIANMWKK